MQMVPCQINDVWKQKTRAIRLILVTILKNDASPSLHPDVADGSVFRECKIEDVEMYLHHLVIS